MISIQERLKLPTEPIEGALWQWACMLRSATPGIVQSFDPVTQTAVVAPAIKERVNIQGKFTQTAIKPLENVPVCMPRVAGWSITLPITAGTECLLVFADSCIDGWWASGGVQVNLDPSRRHDLSDPIAIFGPWSQKNLLDNYSTDSLQIRSDDQSVVIELSSAGVKITGPTITAIAEGGTAHPVMLKAFLDWFTEAYMPSVQYVSTMPTVPSTGLITTVLEAE